MDYFLTENGAPSAFAYTLWRDEAGVQTPISHHVGLDEIEDAADLPLYSFSVPTSFAPRGGMSQSSLTVADREGRPIWDGARVEFTSGRTRNEAVRILGVARAVNEWHQIEILADEALPIYERRGGVEFRSGARRECAFVWTDRREDGLYVAVNHQGGSGAAERSLVVKADPREACLLLTRHSSPRF